MFGNSNLNILVVPGNEVTDDMTDFESIMELMV